MMIKLFAMPQKTWWLRRLNFNISVSSILLLIKNFMKRIHKMKIDARLLFSKWPDLATLLQISLWYSLWSPCRGTNLQLCLKIFTPLQKYITYCKVWNLLRTSVNAVQKKRKKKNWSDFLNTIRPIVVKKPQQCAVLV